MLIAVGNANGGRVVVWGDARLFGEYGVYVDGKMIGSVCDDQLFVKPTASGRVHADPVSDAPPYPGAKLQMLIKADRWDNAEWLGELLRVTTAELPGAKPRKAKRSTQAPAAEGPRGGHSPVIDRRPAADLHLSLFVDC